MTVAELILELKYQPQDMEVSVIDFKKEKLKEYRDIRVQLCQPELADNYVALYINNKHSKNQKVT